MEERQAVETTASKHDEQRVRPYVYEISINGSTLFVQHNRKLFGDDGRSNKFNKMCREIIRALDILGEEITSEKVVYYLKKKYGFEDYGFEADGVFRA